MKRPTATYEKKTISWLHVKNGKFGGYSFNISKHESLLNKPGFEISNPKSGRVRTQAGTMKSCHSPQVQLYTILTCSVSSLKGGEERRGMEVRNEIGFLLWETDEETTADFNLGSRLKTPILPIWITLCNGMFGVLFNPNKELMRSYHAENR